MHGLTGRMGGDEFVMLIPGNSQKHIELLSKWADKKHFFMQKGTSFEFAVSVGYAFYPEHAVGLMDLIHKADKAAYHIKRVKGINSFCYNSVLEKEHRLNMGFSVKDLEYGMPAPLLSVKRTIRAGYYLLIRMRNNFMEVRILPLRGWGSVGLI